MSSPYTLSSSSTVLQATSHQSAHFPQLQHQSIVMLNLAFLTSSRDRSCECAQDNWHLIKEEQCTVNSMQLNRQSHHYWLGIVSWSWCKIRVSTFFSVPLAWASASQPQNSIVQTIQRESQSHGFFEYLSISFTWSKWLELGSNCVNELGVEWCVLCWVMDRYV